MAEIIDFPTPEHSMMVPCKTVLETAYKANLKHVVVLGTNQDGSSFVASSNSLAQAVFLIERAKRHVLDLAEYHSDLEHVWPRADE